MVSKYSWRLQVLCSFISGGYLHGITSLTYGVDIERIRWMGILQVSCSSPPFTIHLTQLVFSCDSTHVYPKVDMPANFAPIATIYQLNQYNFRHGTPPIFELQVISLKVGCILY